MLLTSPLYPLVALEGFGLVLLESLAVGTPVVASAIDGLAEAIKGLAPDLLVPAGDSEALASRLAAAMTGVNPLPSAQTCRLYAERFSWPEVAHRHLGLYERVLVGSSSGKPKTTVPWRVVVLGHTAELSGGELAMCRTIEAFKDIRVHVILAQDGPLVTRLEERGCVSRSPSLGRPGS